jgi:hypothetical protein
VREVKLYRAVGASEYQQILRTQRFETSSSSVEGKYFAESAEHAMLWGKLLFGQEKYYTLEIVVAERDADAFYRIERLDGIGPARFAEIGQLAAISLRIREVEL